MSESTKPNVFWAFLLERTINGHAVDSMLDVAQACILRGYTRISVAYQTTEMARNRIAKSFLEVAKNPNDVIVMLDGDHYHPADIVVRLAEVPSEIGVIGALYFRRGPPYDPLFYSRTADGKLRNMAEWEDGLIYEGVAVATGAIAIKRWVFEKLDAEGLGYPYFQYTYPENSEFHMTEDIFFALQCEKAGIPHYCNTGLVTPHLTVRAIDKQDWKNYVKENPQIIVNSKKQQELEDLKGAKEYDSTTND